MKKRMTKIFAVLFTLLCIPLAMGGGAKGASVQAEEPTTETIALNDFEASAQFNYFMMTNSLGKVSMNADGRYVHGGDASACVYVQPDMFNGRMDAKIPGLFHSVKLEREGKDYTNFRYVTKVKAMVYNPNAEQREIGLQLVYTVKNRSLVTGKAQWYTLEPNAWTEIAFEIGSTTIPVVYKKKAYGLNFVFKRPSAEEKGYTLYLDDLALEKKVLS